MTLSEFGADVAVLAGAAVAVVGGITLVVGLVWAVYDFWRTLLTGG
jgi:hypothetical protein